LQKLLGTINLVCPYLGITNAEFSPLFDLLKDDTALLSPRQLTPEAEEAVRKTEKALTQRKAYRQHIGHPFLLFIFVTLCQTYGLLGQWIPSLSNPLVIL
ncbi:POK18 protein, partial [Ramphastos sulfuratus]|nr:POK18 protein [Ramphastos sulfuratus]